MEIERKWVVNYNKILPLIKNNIGVRIEQHYLNTSDDKWLIRARRYGLTHILTLKSKGLMSREELEFEISENDYLKTIKHSIKSLTKTRFTIPVDGHPDLFYEIDFYDDYDFITCEVEFQTNEDAINFIQPEWCIMDVTNDPSFQNVNLAIDDGTEIY